MLAFLAVQAANLVQGPLTATVAKGEYAAEPAARSQSVQAVPTVPWVEMIATVLLGPAVLAVLCYLFVRRAV
jgi:hypothetical protein